MVLRIGNAIVEILKSAIGYKVADRIIPILSRQEIEMPFVVYRRSGLEPKYTKDKISLEDEIMLGIAVITERYGEGIELASEVLEALESKKVTLAGVKITDIKLEDAFEDADEVFAQGLVFKITINREK